MCQVWQFHVRPGLPWPHAFKEQRELAKELVHAHCSHTIHQCAHQLYIMPCCYTGHGSRYPHACILIPLVHGMVCTWGLGLPIAFWDQGHVRNFRGGPCETLAVPLTLGVQDKLLPLHPSRWPWVCVQCISVSLECFSDYYTF